MLRLAKWSSLCPELSIVSLDQLYQFAECQHKLTLLGGIGGGRGGVGKTEVIFISIRLKTVLGQHELFTDRNTRDYLAPTTGNEVPMHGGVYPTQDTSRAWKQQG